MPFVSAPYLIDHRLQEIRLHLDEIRALRKSTVLHVGDVFAECGDALVLRSLANEFGLPERTLVNGRLSFNPATEWTGGGFVSTPRDLARWAAILFSGAALGEPYLDDLLNFKPLGDDPAVSYGLGCYRWETPFGPALGHTGEAPGYRSVMAWFPIHEKALAIQINSSIPPHEILLELLTAFAGDCF